MQVTYKRILGMTISILLILSSLGGTTALAQSDARLRADSPVYDFGTIVRSNGVVSTSFTLENKGDAPLTIMKIQPTWDCTTASLEVAGRESPRFEMHGDYRGWYETIPPGQSAKLMVYYDPNFHGKQERGLQRWAVLIISNSISGSPYVVGFVARVVDWEPWIIWLGCFLNKQMS